MRIYLLVMFWLGAFTLTINLLELMFRVRWPVERSTSLGEQLAKILIGGGFLFWAGLLLW